MTSQAARILVVDDEAAIRLTLKHLLQRRGYTVAVAASGEEALLLLGQQTFDLLLLDLKMPGMSGLDVARHARALHPAPAILLLTGHAALDDTQATAQRDTVAYMLKTASPEDVLARVATVLQAAG